MPSWKNIKIRKKLFLAFGAGIVANLIVAVGVLWVLGTLQQTAYWTEHTYRVLGALDDITSGMVNQETGLRGYLVAGTENFLEPYRGGTAQTEKAISDVAELTADNPVQQGRIAEVKRLVSAWRTNHAEPTIKLMHDPATVEAARRREASGAGKAGMDAIRAAAKTMRDAESSLLGARSAAAEQAQSTANVILFAGALVSLGIAIMMARALALGVVNPVIAITLAMNRVMGGDVDAKIDVSPREDEIGLLANTARSFAEMAKQLKTETTARVARETAERERLQRESDMARKAAEDDSLVINEIGRGLKAFAAGNLTHRIEVDFAAKMRSMREDFNLAIAKLHDTMSVVTTNTQAIRAGTEEVSTATEDLAQRTERQAATLEETAAALDEVTAAVKRSAEGARHASSVVANANMDAANGTGVVHQAIEAMDGISRASQQIGQIITVIDEIAFQTNLLALNAGVEAARAGEAGRGFAVVASEVRALAQRSAEAAKEIKSLISNSSTQVDAGVKLVGETGAVLDRIKSQVADINHVVAEIASGAQEQATGLQQINTAINQMDQTTQQNAAMVEESSAAARSLSQETIQLASLIDQFRVDSPTDGPTTRRDLRKVAS